MKQEEGNQEHMEEKINIEFSGEEFDFIKNYADSVKADTIQTVILSAIKFAIDNEVHELTKDDFERWKKNPRRDPICMVWYDNTTPFWVLRPEQIHEPAFLMGQLKLFNKKPSRDDIHWS